MDLVVVSLVLILPALLLSWTWARKGAYSKHRNLMTGLGSTLAVVVTLFEVDMRLNGGIFEMSKDSAYFGTALMSVSVWVHLAISITTAIVWAWLLIMSWRRFPRPPEPAEFSRRHRRWGRIGLIAMVLTGITGVELYVVGMAL